MKPHPTVLLIDADQRNRRLLKAVLEPHQYQIYETEDAQTGMKEAVIRRPDVIILETVLPDLDGVTVLKRLREWNRVPVLILSAEDDEDKKVLSLDSGANDYMTKPFSSAELLARLRVLQRSIPGEPDGPLFIHGDLRVDVASHRVTLRGRQVELTPTEEAVFYILVRYAGKMVACQHLMRCVWGIDLENKINDLHVYIRSLRKKLSDDGNKSIIQTEGRAGYRLLLPEDCYHTPSETIPTVDMAANA